MLPLTSLACLLLAHIAKAQTGSPATLDSTEQAFLDHQIVPDVIPSFQPTALLNVVYTDPNTQTAIAVLPGLTLTTNQTALEPTFALVAQDLSDFTSDTYVLAMVDPDAPTPQNTSLAEVRHLVAGDLKVDPSTGHLVNSSVPISSYISPGPPAGSAPHRYTILLYKQSPNFDTKATTLFDPSVVTGFNVSSFAEALGLGSPVAGVFFMEGPAGSSTIANSTTSGSAPTSTSRPSQAGGPTGSSGSSTSPGSAPSVSAKPGGSASNGASSVHLSSLVLGGMVSFASMVSYTLL